MLDKGHLDRLTGIVARLPQARVAVVGDMIADMYVFGRPHKLSREAPVVVISYEGETVVPGSAANTVNNLAALGAKVFAVGAVGGDETGLKLREELRSRGADLSGLFTSACETVVKTRIMAGDTNTVKQQVVRIDRDNLFCVDGPAEKSMGEYIGKLRDRCNVMVVSDYGYSTVTGAVRDAVLARVDVVDLLVDSHDRLSEFPGAWMVTPNEGEAEKAWGGPLDSAETAMRAARELRERLRVRHVLLTRGNQGMVLAGAEGGEQIPICGTEEIMDVSGAGDTVVAVLAAARSVGATESDAAHLANIAASVVVMKRGTATCTADELDTAVRRAGS